MDKKALVEVSGLKQYFSVRKDGGKATLKAVDGVDLTIYSGETLGLVGESGCGKTTVGRSILHLYEPTAGEIRFDGKLLNSRNIKRYRPRMQMVFQDPYSSLNPRMTVSDIIGEPLDVNKMFKDKQQRTDRINGLLHLVGLNSEQATRFPHEFSGGQRQRIGIARALASNPDFVICDESVSSLDVSIQAQVLNMFKEIQGKMGLSYLFIAHDIMVVSYMSDRIAVMYLGKIVEEGRTMDVVDHAIHPYTVSLLSAIPQPDPEIARANKRIVLEGDVPSPVNAPSGCNFRTRCPIATAHCAEEEPQLEDHGDGHRVSCWNRLPGTVTPWKEKELHEAAHPIH